MSHIVLCKYAKNIFITEYAVGESVQCVFVRIFPSVQQIIQYTVETQVKTVVSPVHANNDKLVLRPAFKNHAIPVGIQLIIIA